MRSHLVSLCAIRFGLLGLLLVLAGCWRSPFVGPPAAPLENTGGAQVPLTILRAGGSQTLALVPVYINGEGPFAFALDTGASHSLIEARLAKRLGLEMDGHAVKLSGISAVANGKQVRVDNWRVGDVKLPPRILVTLHMPMDESEIEMQGLLGSDMLSQFGRITIDYQGEKLTLGDR